MTKEYLKDYIIVNTAQYFIGEDIEDKVLDFLISRALNDYGKYREYKFRKKMSFSIGENVFKYDDEGRRIKNILGFYFYNPELSKEVEIPYSWSIDTGKLHVGIAGDFIVKYLAMPILKDIDENDREFLNLILGSYMMYIGETRKMFRIDDLPFSTDADDLYQNGQTLYSETMENLSNNLSTWYLSIK